MVTTLKQQSATTAGKVSYRANSAILGVPHTVKYSEPSIAPFLTTLLIDYQGVLDCNTRDRKRWSESLRKLSAAGYNIVIVYFDVMQSPGWFTAASQFTNEIPGARIVAYNVPDTDDVYVTADDLDDWAACVDADVSECVYISSDVMSVFEATRVRMLSKMNNSANESVKFVDSSFEMYGVQSECVRQISA